MAARYKHGTYRVILTSGAEFTFTGGLRFTLNADGYIIGYESRTDAIILEPSLSRIAVILRLDAAVSGEAQR